jgi:thioesterase domain-containing protein
VNGLTAELERIWHTEIPISAAMDVRIHRFADDALEVHAALAPNVNVHGTAFAGSLYAIAALTGWGLTWLQLRRRSLSGHIVIAEGAIRYTRPVAEDIVARCRFDAARHAPAFAQLRDAGKCRLALDCSIVTSAGEAATFNGQYAVRIVDPPSSSPN